MTDQTKQPDVPSKARHWQLIVFGVLLSVVGLILLVRGATLMALGGSWYYAIAGLLLLASGVLLVKARMEAVWIYAVAFVGTILWALWEVGLSFWPLVPRLAPVLVLAFLFALAFPILSGGQRRKESYALAGLLLVGMVVGCAFMFQSHGVVRQSLANASVADAPPAGENWQYYGRNPRGTRFAPDQQITKDNVSNLQVAWTFRTGELAQMTAYTFQNTPTQIGDTLYVCTPRNKVFALDAETGAQRWMFDPQTESVPVWNRCRGVGYYEPAAQYATQAFDDGTCAQRIVLTTIDARLIQLDAKTGQPCASFGNNGSVNLTVNMGEVKPGYYYPTSTPTVMRNLILVGGWVRDGEETGEPSGVVRAFHADTGALVWAWDLGNPDVKDVPPPEGYSRGTPNMWSTPAFDDELGLVYLPLGNGTPDFWGAHRSQATNDYASAVVALDIETGRERWKFQTVHIDTWDYDIGTQPALYDIPDGRGGVIPALIQATKIGQIYVLDRRDGTPVFPIEERPVPQEGHQPGNIFAPTQPFSVGMPAFGGDTLTEKDMWGATFFDQLECRIAFKRLNYVGIYTPIVTDVATMIYPGYLGGMNWGSVAVDEQRGLLIVNDIRLPQLAIHMPQGSVTPDVVAATGFARAGTHVQAGTPYSTIRGLFYSGLGIPCHAPPWGVLAAVDMRTGSLVWQRPAGTVEDVVLGAGFKARLPIPIGMPTLGGPLSTASGLVFYAGTQDYYLRAFDTVTGDELWKGRLPVGAQATPMTYTSPASGRQFVVVAAGGTAYSPDLGDYIVAYALPR